MEKCEELVGTNEQKPEMHHGRNLWIPDLDHRISNSSSDVSYFLSGEGTFS